MKKLLAKNLNKTVFWFLCVTTAVISATCDGGVSSSEVLDGEFADETVLESEISISTTEQKGIIAWFESSTVNEKAGTKLKILLDRAPVGNVSLDVALESDVRGASVFDWDALTGVPTGVEVGDDKGLSETVFFGTSQETKEVSIFVKDDNMINPDRPIVFSITPNASTADEYYKSLEPVKVILTVNDDEKFDFELVAADSSVGEDGDGGNFILKINNRLAGEIGFTLTSSDESEGTVSSYVQGSWPPSNWSVAVNGIDDSIADGNVNFDITVSVDNNFNANYPKYPEISRTITITNQDND